MPIHVATRLAGEDGGVLFHVSSVQNRDSILKHGLDWTLIGNAVGIAGSRRPEVEGVFLCVDEGEMEWFIDLNNTGGPVDVWAVDGVDGEDLIDAGSGHYYLPLPIHPTQLSLLRTDVPPGRLSD